MSNNDWKSRLGMVYSTNSDFEYTNQEEAQEATLLPSQQMLRIWVDRKHRAGKTATLIKGFVGTEYDLKELTKSLKSKCGVGGATKDGEVIIQGDHRDRIFDLLVKAGYKCKKAGG